MPIFQDANGLAIKFFVQKDLSEDIQAELCETITTLGGRVEEKIPRQGFILVQPGTAEEERLRICWTKPERPDRHIVPYTYVEACKIAGMLLKQIFVENGAPIGMHIHPSIANVNARSALSQRIMHSGGDPHASATSARVILADPNTEIFQHLVKQYQNVADKYIESYLWVKKCIERGVLMYTPLVYKNPGGRRAGEERTHFTDEDEDHLCAWIAAKIPYKETGGRTGNRLYQQLCDMSNEADYSWASRHTWQSWRERYKKNAVRLDGLITALVEKNRPVQGEKGQYGYVRQAEEKPKRVRKPKKISKTQEQNLERNPYFDSGGEGEGEGTGPTGLRVLRMDVPSGPPVAAPEIFMASQPLMMPEEEPPHPSAEEAEDGDESGTWAVKIGDAPPPTWAKRKASDESEGSSDPKRSRRSDRPPEDGELSSQTVMAIASIHVVDQSIRDIAKETRFTVEEVREYYDKCGDMNRTGKRFQKMRERLSRLDEDEDD